LIPTELQQAAGVQESSSAGMRKLARLQLERWLRSSPRVILSWPTREADAELEPSPLLRTTRACEAAALPSAQTLSLRRKQFEHRPPLELVLDERAPALTPGVVRGGARILELQSHCPFRAQAEMRLHAKQTPSLAVGLDPRERGKIVHRVLERLWGELQEQQALLALDEGALTALVRNFAERETTHVVRATTGRRARLAALEIASIMRQVMELLALERARPPFRVRLAEAAQVHAIGGLAITLRPDRIDELSDRGALLIDYKLGDSHTPRDWLDSRPGRPRSPQLPLYALAHEQTLAALAFVVLAPGAVGYRGWARSDSLNGKLAIYPGKLARKLDPPADWESLVEHWRGALTALAEGYVRGDAAVDPLPHACANCHLSSLCRIHEQGDARDAAENADG
jgi:ATP-dependent helicase/nuclease subunit B